jgi:hypothetical protein
MIVVLILVGAGTNIHAMSILASVFNATYSCTNPFIATGSTTIILDENIVMTAGGACELFQSGGGFDPATDSITFTSTANFALVITQGTTWKISVPFLFTGNAQLCPQVGSSYWLNNGALVFNGSSKISSVIP